MFEWIGWIIFIEKFVIVKYKYKKSIVDMLIVDLEIFIHVVVEILSCSLYKLFEEIWLRLDTDSEVSFEVLKVIV